MSFDISLEKSAQSTFSKAVKNITSLIQKREIIVKDETDEAKVTTSGAETKKALLGTKVQGKPARQSRKLLGRGIVFLSHIPPGFCEKEMFAYFSQFGSVTRIKLARSKKTGNPKGFAFIEFLYSEVAQVVAETMNNYLMGGRLLKAEYIPGGKPSCFFFGSAIRPGNCPRVKSQMKWNQKINKKFTDEEEQAEFDREKRRLDRLKKELQENGIDLDCQVEGILQAWKVDSITLIAKESNKLKERDPVLEIDESDEEVQFKVHPEVKVLKRKSTSNASGVWEVKVRQDKLHKKRISKMAGMKQKEVFKEKLCRSNMSGMKQEAFKEKLCRSKMSGMKQKEAFKGKLCRSKMSGMKQEEAFKGKLCKSKMSGMKQKEAVKEEKLCKKRKV